MRARIVERLNQSGPTVSQTIARMERDNLVTLADDRRLCLTAEGRKQAVSVMRKHRLAERLLIDIIGLEWEQVHVEACRWEHVMSDAVERRIVAMLEKPLVCPHGNPIPGLEELGLPFSTVDPGVPVLTMRQAAGPLTRDVVVDRISEQLQPDVELMHELDTSGIRPGDQIKVSSVDGGVEVTTPTGTIRLSTLVADHVFVSSPVVAAA